MYILFENKPPPQSGVCILLKMGWGAYFQEDMVHELYEILIVTFKAG